ncbi:acid sensing ion channel 4 pituitary, partial [Clonorchis sinensis]
FSEVCLTVFGILTMLSMNCFVKVPKWKYDVLLQQLFKHPNSTWFVSSGTAEFSRANSEFYLRQKTHAFQPTVVHCTVKKKHKTQTPKSPILYSVLALRNPSLYSRSARTVSLGLRIQQRAFLQLVNRTAFEELEKLRAGFSELQNELRRTTTQLYLLRKQLWNDERSLMQRAERNAQCLTSSLQHIRSLVNTSSSFYEDLCALSLAEQLYTGNILHCNSSVGDEFRTNTTEEEDIRRKTILVGQMSHGFSVDNQFGKTRADMIEQYAETSKSNLLELQLINLFFATSISGSQLKDVLRKYLRPLSAKRMQLKPRIEGPQSRENLQDRQELGPSDRFGKSHSSDPCDGRSQMGLEEKFHDWLVEIGKQIAASLQRLELFVDSTNAIVSANRPIIEAFQFSQGNISRIHPTGLVSFTIQLEADSNFLMTHQVTSLDTVLNPF